MIERYKSILAYIRPILGIWFLVGMPLSMLLSSLYSFFGLPQSSLLFFLTSMTYVSGGMLGGAWSGEHVWRNRSLRVDTLGPLCVLVGSIGFLCLGVVFAIVAFKRL